MELIRVYKELAQKNAVEKLKIDDFSFKGLLKDLKITLKVTVAGGTAQMFKTVEGVEEPIGAGKDLDKDPTNRSLSILP